MKAEQILKSITPEVKKREIEKIQKVKLPVELQKWVREYEKVGERSSYLWLWSYKSVRLVTFSSVHPKYHESLYKLKWLMVMFITLLDDVSDKLQNKKLLNEILKVSFMREDIKFHHLRPEEKRYINFTIKIWYNIIKIIKKYPRYKEFKDVFEFDCNQIFNVMEYAYLVNKKHCLINKAEYWLYFPFNIQFILNFTIDLMCSPKFDTEEIGTLREATWHMQRIIQTANWISTWEREIDERDFTSGVFACAIDSGLLKISELNKGNKINIISKIKESDTEEKLLKEAWLSYKEIDKMEKKIKAVNIKKFIINLEKFIILQLSSRKNY